MVKIIPLKSGVIGTWRWRESESDTIMDLTEVSMKVKIKIPVSWKDKFNVESTTLNDYIKGFFSSYRDTETKTAPVLKSTPDNYGGFRLSYPLKNDARILTIYIKLKPHKRYSLWYMRELASKFVNATIEWKRDHSAHLGVSYPGSKSVKRVTL